MVSKDRLCSRMHRRVLTDVCWLDPAVKRQHVERVWNGQPEREIQGLFFATCIGDVEWLTCSCKSHCALVVLCHCDYCFSWEQFIEYLSTLFLMHCGKNKKYIFVRNLNDTISYGNLWWFVKGLYCCINESCCYCYKICIYKDIRLC